LKVKVDYLIKEKYKFDKRLINEWIQWIVESENKKLGQIQIILTSDRHLLELNQKFLKRNEYTDVIAFSNNKKTIINGDIFISQERVEENAEYFKEEIKKELCRVIVHGILHLVGYEDYNEAGRKSMTDRENDYLNSENSVLKVM